MTMTTRQRFILDHVHRGLVMVQRKDTPHEHWWLIRRVESYEPGGKRQPSFREITKLKAAGWIDYLVDPGNKTIYADGREENHHRAMLTDAGKQAIGVTT